MAAVQEGFPEELKSGFVAEYVRLKSGGLDGERCTSLRAVTAASFDARQRASPYSLTYLKNARCLKHDPAQQAHLDRRFFVGRLVVAADGATPEANAAAQKKTGGRQPLPRHLKRERIVRDLPNEEKHCKGCAQDPRLIGDKSSERYEYIPASLLWSKKPA